MTRRITGDESSVDRGRWLFSFLFCVLMASLAVGFNKTVEGEEFGSFVYRLSQRWIDPRNSKDVIVVDISELKNGKPGITPRGALMDLVQSIADQGPKVIGIAIDFSPDHGHFIDPDDPSFEPETAEDSRRRAPLDNQVKGFFPFCLKMRAGGLPIYLGVYRSIVQGLPATEWLGLPAFKELAAALPMKDPPERSLQSLAMHDSDSSDWGGVPNAPTLSWALAYQSLKGKRRAWHLGSQFLPEEVTENFKPKAFYINYGARDWIQKNAIKPLATDFASLERLRKVMDARVDDIRGRLVLIGDASGAKQGDLFSAPSSKERAIPGVLVHACAVETLIDSPLYAFPLTSEFAVDLLFSFSLLFIVHLALRYDALLREERLASVVYTGVAFAVLIFGRLINYTGIFWPDFVVLAAGLLVHPWAHKKAERRRILMVRWMHKRPQANKG